MQKIGQYVGIEDSVAIVTVQGGFKLDVTERVRAELDDAYRRGCTAVRFDMGNTDYIDSTVSKLILRAYRRVGNTKLEIANPKGRVLASLEAAAMNRFFVNGGRQA